MPKQETYFEKVADGRLVTVIKSYDPAFAREAFEAMGDDALAFLETSLSSDGKIDEDVAVQPDEAGYPEMLWEGVLDGAREDWNTFSYFIVLTSDAPAYVSSDWPSAEAYANRLCDVVTT